MNKNEHQKEIGIIIIYNNYRKMKERLPIGFIKALIINNIKNQFKNKDSNL